MPDNMNTTGITATKEDLNDMIAEADIDKSGTIEFDGKLIAKSESTGHFCISSTNHGHRDEIFLDRF